jgi:hypothetical protein
MDFRMSGGGKLSLAKQRTVDMSKLFAGTVAIVVGPA